MSDNTNLKSNTPGHSVIKAEIFPLKLTKNANYISTKETVTPNASLFASFFDC